jgi:aminodeoxyfutalosine synthase
MPDLLSAIRDKLEAGRRLSTSEGEALFLPEVGIHTLGQWADRVRRAKNDRVAYYNINAHLNPTNVCVFRCPLCAYSRDAGDATAAEMTIDAILARGQEAVEIGATEVHIVGGCDPRKDFSWYLTILRRLHEAFPQLHLKAWTAAEIAWFAQQANLSIRQVLEAMVEAGLGSLPGGGAEVFAPDVRKIIAPRKCDADVWIDVHRTAHRLGLRSNATMLYGHLETPAQRIDHLARLRALQDETGGFQAFIPLAFHPAGTALADRVPQPPTAMLDLRMMAISRLMLDNFDHIKAYWISLGVSTAQLALAYGADDLDGTVRHEKIHHDAGSKTPQALGVDELRGLIREAGFEPVERDTLYHRVERA